MNLLKTLADLEEDDNIHMARLLVLLNTFAGKNNSRSIEGLTKLAKLDFLLRYPVYLERALEAKRRTKPFEKIQPAIEADVQEHERKSVESAMVRFHYGPWDHRYRRFLNLMVARGMVRVELQGRTFHIYLTEVGQRVAQQLSDNTDYEDIARRTKVIKRHFDIGGTALKNFVYETFPEITTMRLGKEIRHVDED